MGFMNWLSGGRARGGSFDRAPGGGAMVPAGGNHAIDAGRVLVPTHPAAITPTNPGNFATVRTAPIVSQPRYFNQQEAAAIRQLATERRQQIGSTRSAYKGLKQLEKADAIVHEEHRDYETAVSKGELKKKRADVKHAKHLHTQRPAYARMATGLELADQRAVAQIGANQQQQIQRHQQFVNRLQQVR